eukprot:2812267-Pyramimonas_sp.AAC.1
MATKASQEAQKGKNEGRIAVAVPFPPLTISSLSRLAAVATAAVAVDAVGPRLSAFSTPTPP